MHEAGNKTQLDRVTPGREYDRNRRGRRFGRQRRRCARRRDDGDVLLNQIGRQRRQPVILVFRPAVLGCHVLTLDIADLLQALAKCAQTFGVVIERSRAEKPNHRYRRLLRARRYWPRHRRAADQRDELASRHSITSSAAACSVSGTVRPSALAVLRLITSSNFVGCTTGKSAGFSPLRTFPV